MFQDTNLNFRNQKFILFVYINRILIEIVKILFKIALKNNNTEVQI